MYITLHCAVRSGVVVVQVLRDLSAAARALPSHAASRRRPRRRLLGRVARRPAAAAPHPAPRPVARRRRPSAERQRQRQRRRQLLGGGGGRGQRATGARLRRVFRRLPMERRVHARLLRRRLHRPGQMRPIDTIRYEMPF